MNNPLEGVDISKLMESISANQSTPQFNFTQPVIPQIDPKSTVQWKIEEQTRVLKEQAEQQIRVLTEQNEQLCALVKQRDKELDDNNVALVASQKSNKIMTTITAIACLAAVVSAVIAVLAFSGVTL